MLNPFSTEKMSVGYAEARPPVHPLVMQRAAPALTVGGRVLDVGCGSGLSTRALNGFAAERVGVEPAEAMVRVAASVDLQARLVVGRAEVLPFEDRSFDWMTAAGSLNYVHLSCFFAEAARVLRPEGSLLVYDFSPGRTMKANRALEGWFNRFVERYPRKQSEALYLDPERLQCLGYGFQVSASEHFELGVSLTREFYVRYMMTESNVAYALRRGIEETEIRDWVEETLPVEGWGEIVFRGYWAIMRVWN